MRVRLDTRALRILRRVPHTTVYSAMELLLLSLLAVQCARLAWTIVTPVGPVGEWKATSALRPPAPPAASLTGGFDPFFRLSGASTAPMVVTSLNLKLYGVRENRASGGGAAIIGLPDGQQRSFAVGEEIVPGVTLTGVSFEGITISRGGAVEQLYLDQSRAPGAAAGQPQTQAAPSIMPNFSVAPPPPAAAPAPMVPPTPVPVVRAPEVAPPPEIRNGQ